MSKKVVIAGGTGFIGNYFSEQFQRSGYEVIIISRQTNHIQWQDTEAIQKALENSELLINLAGKSINCRYTEESKHQILTSRTATTKVLSDILLKCANPPELWINSSAATYYRSAEDRPMTESSGEIGDGFSVQVVQSWEKTFFDFQLPKTRQAALRISIVLGKNGGFITPYINLVRFGLGGTQGPGNQMVSWIHIEDLYRIVKHLQSNKVLSGAFICSSPTPVSNKTLMKTFRQTMNINFGLPAPKWILEISAIVIKTETELVLKSCWVLPERLLESGFKFKYSTLQSALKNVLTNE
jgi:uncharacterized protein (TIGR01777 family)